VCDGFEEGPQFHRVGTAFGHAAPVLGVEQSVVRIPKEPSSVVQGLPGHAGPEARTFEPGDGGFAEGCQGGDLPRPVSVEAPGDVVADLPGASTRHDPFGMSSCLK
jgi:hypothetical protein